MKTLIIPDIHQDITWANSILEKETYNNVIFLGDYFDTHDKNKNIYGVSETTEWIINRMENNPNDVFLLGNHDVQYYETSILFRLNSNYRCSGFSKNKANKIKDSFALSYWKKCKPFHILGDLLISHAGIQEHLLKYTKDNEIKTSLELLYNEAETVLEHLPFSDSIIYGCGYTRGGMLPNSGLTWCDFHYEFKPLEDKKYRQIVGHTGYDNYVRELDNNFCIDGNQTTYAKYDNETNQLTFHSTKPNFTVISLEDK
jgi:hypothetical protein